MKFLTIHSGALVLDSCSDLQSYQIIKTCFMATFVYERNTKAFAALISLSPPTDPPPISYMSDGLPSLHPPHSGFTWASSSSSSVRWTLRMGLTLVYSFHHGHSRISMYFLTFLWMHRTARCWTWGSKGRKILNEVNKWTRIWHVFLNVLLMHRTARCCTCGQKSHKVMNTR